MQHELAGITGPLLANGKGKTFTTGTFREVWETELAGEALAPIKAAGLVPHGFCKNAHSRLREAGRSKEQIQAITNDRPLTKSDRILFEGCRPAHSGTCRKEKFKENEAKKFYKRLKFLNEIKRDLEKICRSNCNKNNALGAMVLMSR
jgi:hypothetical protein